MGELDGMGCFRSGVYRDRYRTYESFLRSVFRQVNDNLPIIFWKNQKNKFFREKL